jgi:AcrR family transcriptional regulator
MARAASAAVADTARSLARERLLDRAVRHALAHGLRDTSLRSIATELDTSHRMLIYHFGSAEGFWDALLDRLRLQDLRQLARATAPGRLPKLEQIWEQLSAPRHLPQVRLLFQIYGRALQDRTRFARFRRQVVAGWIDTIAGALQQHFGLSAASARREARLNLAVMRGLLLDLLTTGDREGTTAALHEYARRTQLRASTRARRQVG